MTVKNATRAMRRKAGDGRPAPEVGRMSAVRAWKIAAPRTAEDVLGVQAAVVQADEQRVVRDGLGELVPNHALIALLEGPEERFGVAILDAQLLSALIEAVTTGRIAGRTPEPREPTRTDAMMIADFVDSLLEGFETNLAEMEDSPNFAGYRYAAPLADTRSMLMTLAEAPFSLFRLILDLGGGVRRGELIVAFPVAPKSGSRGNDITSFRLALRENVMDSPAHIDAALYRLKMPISKVTKLQCDDVLRIPLSALADVEVEALRGPSLARARLGQQGGFRALRITHVAGERDVGEETASLEFEDAARSPRPAALPLAPSGQDDGDVTVRAPSTSVGLDDAEVPDLPERDAGELPDIPGLPPLSG